MGADIRALTSSGGPLHAVLTLPPDDADYPSRWRLIKTLFSKAVLAAGAPVKRHPNHELALWQRRFWEHTIRSDDDLARHVDTIHFNPIKHGLVRASGIGRTRRFTGTCVRVCCRTIGRVTPTTQVSISASGTPCKPHERNDVR